MNELFHDMAVVVIVYINNILIFTKTEEGHDEIVEEVLRRLRANDLFLKPEKCFFKQWEIEFLGLIIGPNGVEMELTKVDGITKWPIPTEVKEVQSFLGLANFYRRFVKDFSKVATPLHKLTQKDQKWEWNAVHQKAFDELKISTLTKCEDYSQYKLPFPFPVFLLVSLREPLWFECVLTALSKPHNDMTCYADFHRGQAPEYKVGNKVWLSTKNLNVDWPSRKLTERQLEPYEIVKIISLNAVKLKLPASFKIHNVINVSHIHPYRPPVAGQSIIPPKPVTVAGTLSMK